MKFRQAERRQSLHPQLRAGQYAYSCYGLDSGLLMSEKLNALRSRHCIIIQWKRWKNQQ